MYIYTVVTCAVSALQISRHNILTGETRLVTYKHRYVHGKYLYRVEAQFGAIVIQRIQKSLINLVLIQRFVGYLTKFICILIYIQMEEVAASPTALQYR